MLELVVCDNYVIRLMLSALILGFVPILIFSWRILDLDFIQNLVPYLNLGLTCFVIGAESDSKLSFRTEVF
jgi:hypothetical protein